MANPYELETKFWKKLASDKTVMIGLAGVDEAHQRPMTGLVEGEKGPIWFYTSKDTDLAEGLTVPKRAIMSFVAKDHDLFASVHGILQIDNDRDMIDHFWNAYVSAWFDKGKDDPMLTLLRFEPDRGEIWENVDSLIAGAKMLFGADPKEEFADKVAEVNLS